MKVIGPANADQRPETLPMNHKQVIGQLEGSGALRRIDPFTERETLDKLFKKIDPAYMFAEIPTLWVSRKRSYPSVLIYDVTVYDVRDVEGTKKALGMEARW